MTVRAHDVFCLYPTPRGQVAALRGLTLDVAPGERVVVHGPNGSGKTTLLRVLMGEVAPSAGSVRVCGVELVGAGDAARSRLRGASIGLVDQLSGRNLRPEIAVLDNVALQLRLNGVRPRTARQRARSVLDRLDLGHLAGRRPATLSGGEAQRVAVCAAVVHEPPLLLADEPTGELDRTSAEAVYDLLAAAANAVGASLLVVSHDARAARVADRIVRIRDGRLSEEWQPSTVDSSTGGSVPAAESLVIDDRGWLRLPEPLRRRTGLTTRAHARTDGTAIVLSPTGPEANVAMPDAHQDEHQDEHQDAVRPVVGATVATVDGVVVVRGGRTVLDGVRLRPRAGTLTAVEGRSGSGKSTLLRVLCGLEDPDAGTVVVAGIDLAGLDRAGRAAVRRRAVAVAGQGTALVETMDVRENLDLARIARGLAVDSALVDRVVVELDLTALTDRPVRVLSGGERQRVAVARVLVTEPSLAVFDEPTSHQDEAHAETVVAALRSSADRGVAVVVATHDPVLLAAADEVLTLDAVVKLDGSSAPAGV